MWGELEGGRLPLMKVVAFLSLVFVLAVCASGQTAVSGTDIKLVLPAHQGQLHWHADGFIATQFSAKPHGEEIGIRGRNEPEKITYLGFLFLVAGETSLTGTKCRDGAMASLRRSTPALKILATSEIATPRSLPVELVTYTTQGDDGRTIYSVRGFVAAGDICGDLELYSETPTNSEDPAPKKIFQSYHFDPSYSPEFKDVLMYAQILFENGMYGPAAPIFERSLTMLTNDKSQDMWRRVATDQAGMSYGMSGNIPKARSIFKSAIAKDPDYPLYYYNLACADAEEKKLADARMHLRQAFARKANVIPGESMPDPSKDDSFLPYRDDREFWNFVVSLH